ncbi:MAG TPA: copper homeostasis membrane protein CopD [Roseiarcus sp.]|nr:copper homeostasis membrane protein CopD [Roseiarcus sp.]
MESALALCRFAHFLSAMALFGASVYVRLLAPPDLARALAPAARRIAAIAIPVAALSALVWLALEAASMADSWSGLVDADVLQGVLMDTAFGVVWQGRLVVALALVIALASGRQGPSSVTLALSGLLLASLCLVGHASMQAGAVGALHRANHVLHLLATGAWLGGLPLFALCLRAYRDAVLRGEAVSAMRRFSFWGQFDVALVVLTGAVNVALTSGAAPFPATTPYRALLAMKIALVATMISIALLNRYVLAPRLKPGAPALGILLRTSLAEIAFGAAVVALVSAFGLLDPF